jgi:signal transduction histidine kinase
VDALESFVLGRGLGEGDHRRRVGADCNPAVHADPEGGRTAEHAQLEAAKSALEREVSPRRGAEAALEEARRELEKRVDHRTRELQVANTMLEQQREEIAQADRAKGNFLPILSHELRNPVHAIRMSAA